MKKAFTLVELLVVVTVISILMAMAVRFGNIGTNVQKRNLTVTRMQRLENALSGYYAAFGTYPPVHLQGSRNYNLKVNEHGVQNNDGQENTDLWGWLSSDGKTVTNDKAEKAAWEQVEAACVAQPVACYYPYADDYRSYVDYYSEAMKAYAEQASDDDLSDARRAVYSAGFDTGTPIGRFSQYRSMIDWQDLQIFKFGLLSYLLPRYLFMMEGPEDLFTDYAQWTSNNQLPCDPLRGSAYSGGWKSLRDDVNNDLARVQNIPSQAVCARWMSNFEHSLSCARTHTFFGIEVKVDDTADSIGEDSGEEDQVVGVNKDLTIYSPGNGNGTSGQYILNSMTIKDGWGNEFYYYSPAPYQSYLVWSAGANKRTFPPWVSRESLESEANRCVGYWTADDIVSLKH